MKWIESEYFHPQMDLSAWSINEIEKWLWESADSSPEAEAIGRQPQLERPSQRSVTGLQQSRLNYILTPLLFKGQFT